MNRPWSPREYEAAKERQAARCVERNRRNGKSATDSIHAPYAVLTFPPVCSYDPAFEGSHDACQHACHYLPVGDKRLGREPTRAELQDITMAGFICACWLHFGHYDLVTEEKRNE